jgi:hypothetical protein
MKAIHLSARVLSVVLVVSSAVLVSGFAANASDCKTTTEESRPIALGVSGGNLDSLGGGFCCTGTLGSLVQVGSTQYILSANHVLATNNGSQLVIQPGLVDLGCMQNSAYGVADGISDISISPSGMNTVDAAIARVFTGDVNASGDILNIGNVASGAAVTPTLNLSVQKMGRTTCLTSGRVTAVNVTIKVNYPAQCNVSFSGIATFTNQIEIGPSNFSAAGDSGALIVTTGSCPEAVGLLFAGSGTTTFANPMSTVLSDFGATMVGKTCTPGAGSHPGPPIPPRLARPNPANVDAAVAVKQRHELDLLAQPSVLGTGVGVSSQGQPVIKVYVEEATPAVRASIPPSLERLPVQVEETGPIVAY